MKGNLRKILARSLAEILLQGVSLIEQIDNESFSQTEKGDYQNAGTVGGHFRHCLEFINCFLAGIDTGKIDYGLRERNWMIETDCNYAVDEIKKTIERLKKFQAGESSKSKFLQVKSENTLADDFWCKSSIERELEFLNSHTIHHYALIGFKMRVRGFDLPNEFGVASSTLRFWNEQQISVVR